MRVGSSCAEIRPAITFVVVASALVAATACAADLHSQLIGSAPVYLFRDSAGKAYALELPGPGDSALARHYVSSVEFAALTLLGARIDYLPEHPDESVGPCTSVAVPRDFNIALVDGIVFGNIARCDPGGRPVGATSQSVDFVLFSSGYRGEAAHTVVMPWFKNALHGHGIYFGDTSAFACADGQDATFNTRIEGWSQWAGFGGSRNPYWTSTGPSETQTCGSPMSDGWTPRTGEVTTAFEVRVQSGVDQWVRYDVQRWDGATWISHTSPIVRDMTYANWPAAPGTFDPNANGVFIGSTGPLGPSSGATWIIGIRDLTVTWSGGWEATQKSDAVEFYNALRDHYFVTADAGEIHDLDDGIHPGWSRTGSAFTVGAPSDAYGEAVCRFYGLPTKGLDSHFYSANSGECQAVASRFADMWLMESPNVFRVDLPDTITGACRPGTIPVYRLWNARADSNHRYVVDVALRDAMRRLAYIPEGYGALGVAMCAPMR